MGRILAVDDEVDMLALLKMMVENYTSHQVTVTNNPLEALELLKRKIFDCPSLTFLAGKAGGGSWSTNNTLGIGMNFPEFGFCVKADTMLEEWRRHLVRETSVVKPSATVVFADAGGVANPNDKNADNRAEDKDSALSGTGCSYFRVPSDADLFLMGDSRSLPRHVKGVNVAHWDGHAESMRNSVMGYYRSNGTLTQVGDPGSALWDKK